MCTVVCPFQSYLLAQFPLELPQKCQICRFFFLLSSIFVLIPLLKFSIVIGVIFVVHDRNFDIKLHIAVDFIFIIYYIPWVYRYYDDV